MNKIILFFVGIILKIAIKLRYRVHVKGLDKLNKENLSKSGGILFLPNHAAVFVDPAMILLALFTRYHVRPLVVDYMYETPVVKNVMKALEAVSIPDFDFSSNVLKIKESEKALEYIKKALKKGDNFLIYPAARTKDSPLEEVGGSSGVFSIIQDVPEANIVLVRIAGLWGSSFSRCYTGSPPPLFTTILNSVKTIFKNLIFFVPKRDITITFEPAPADFPFLGSKKEINRYLENWYNLPDGLTKQDGKYPGDSLVRVSYSRWKEELLEPYREDKKYEEKIDLTKVSESVRQKVFRELARLSNHQEALIHSSLHLHQDLGLDSLDAAQMALFLHQEFRVPIAPPMELQTVLICLGIASKQIKIEPKYDETPVDLAEWLKPVPHNRLFLEPGDTIPELFLKICEKKGNAVMAVDRAVGVITYARFKLGVIVLAEKIQKMPGQYIGVMFPASIAAFMVILAIQMAGKIPMMVNWTIGSRHLEAMMQISKAQVVISSWRFIDRLGNTDLKGIDENLVMLEDLRKHITLKDKLKGLFLSKRSPEKIFEKMGLKNLKKEDLAVLIFTSGTESLPKGVPLTHHNLLTNIKSGMEHLELYEDDVMLGMLPPFHSFGFTVSGFLPILTGFKIAFSPNPTDGTKIAHDFADFKATIILGAPTFLRSFLNASTLETLKTLRLCVSGAEAAPIELIKELQDFGKDKCFVEGYGITECSPIICGNILGKENRGVGWPLNCYETMIVNVETHQEVKHGETGLLLVRGPSVFSGYLNPGLDSPFIEVNGKTWYNTGDLGYFDEEGRFIISGRTKRFVKISGEMISLNALELAVHQIAMNKNWFEPDQESVSIAAVCAKEVPGEKTKVYLATTIEVDSDLINDAMRQAGFSTLMRFSKVVHLSFIPLLATGKINYRLVEEMIEQKLKEENGAHN